MENTYVRNGADDFSKSKDAMHLIFPMTPFLEDGRCIPSTRSVIDLNMVPFTKNKDWISHYCDDALCDEAQLIDQYIITRWKAASIKASSPAVDLLQGISSCE